MLGLTHIAAGFLAAGVIAHHTTLRPLDMAILTAGTVLGALTPDLDQQHSTLSSMVKPVGLIISSLTGHRKLIHDPVLYLAIFGTLFWTSPSLFSWFLPLGAGIATHLFLDALTPMGVPILYPIFRGKARIRLLNIKTGSWAETGIRYLLWAAALTVWVRGFVKG